MNQDMWLKYLYTNLGQLEDLEWVRYLVGVIQKMELQFNPGQFRGALFHLNFQANEKARYMKKIKKQKQKN